MFAEARRGKMSSQKALDDSIHLVGKLSSGLPGILALC
jgi:hypothetical protein